jgi:hypothetical protein
MLLDDDNWRLACYIDWKPKKESYEIQCKICNGRGKVGGGFRGGVSDIDGPDICSSCNGHGKHYRRVPESPKPKMPHELVEHMRAAWREFFDKNLCNNEKDRAEIN